jgi:hypothetical protein
MQMLSAHTPASKFSNPSGVHSKTAASSANAGSKGSIDDVQLAAIGIVVMSSPQLERKKNKSTK